MENGKITIDLKEYIQFAHWKESKHENRKYYRIRTIHNNYWEAAIVYLNSEEVDNKVFKANEELREELEGFKYIRDRIYSLKELTILQFIKWRKLKYTDTFNFWKNQKQYHV